MIPRIRPRRAPLAAVLAALALAAPLHAQDSLTALLRANAHVMRAEPDGSLSGPGAELLIAAGRDAQFFLVGEEHGVAEVPRVTGALFRALAPAGYRHLAIETGDALAAELNRQVLADATGAAYTAFLRDHHPVAPFYGWREDAAMLREVIGAAGGRPDVLWGLDYDIMADRYALRRLRDMAPSARARAVADSVIAVADSSFRLALSTPNPGLLMMFGGPDDVYAPLRQAYAPAPGSEADRILRLMEETRVINGQFGRGQNYLSNYTRAQLNKRQLMRFLDEARARDGQMPRVMMKFGFSHMVRGRSVTQVFDLGTLASELADVNGGHSFGVLMLPGAGSSQAVTDPRVFRSMEVPVEVEAWAQPFYAAADPGAWTVIDLRPFRNRIPRLGALPDATLRVLYGFDAVVILSGSGPQHDMELR
ncbi:hypothetical protein [Longimicrobium sp.]|uniref:hypothetical protein n=1 Tax=Longimicrobium sp. TaxID=2029185 RepID=UPI002E3115C5|nr:hypothetical protein [Longimicrobium sp.]HEX6042452.1 hypothetical protein [Longimicrobium sp.]